MKIKPYISIKSNILNVEVYVDLELFYRSEDNEGFEKEEVISKNTFNYPRKFKLNIPFHLNYDGYLYDHLNSINTVLARALNEISIDVKNKAREAQLSSIDGVRFIIKNLGSKKVDDEEKVAEWSLS
jgi:hypothetical protein